MLNYISFREKLCINDTREADIIYHVYLLLMSEIAYGSINIVNTNIGLTLNNKLLFHCLVRLEKIFKKLVWEHSSNKILLSIKNKGVCLVFSTKDNCAATLQPPTYGIFLLDENLSNVQRVRLTKIKELKCPTFVNYRPLSERLGLPINK